MSGFFETLLKTLLEADRRKLRSIVMVAIVVFGLVCFYEWFTASFRITRLQKATELLLRVQELQNRGTNMAPDLEAARRTLIQQVKAVIEEKPTLPSLALLKPGSTVAPVLKFVAGGSLCFLWALLLVPQFKRPSARQSLLGLIVAGALIGLVAILLPAIWWPWFHLFILPGLSLCALLIITAPFTLPALGAARRKAQEVNCVNNLKQIGLAARTWALNHKDFLPNDFAEMKMELGTDIILQCPSGGCPSYMIMSPGASCEHPTQVYAKCLFHGSLVLADGTVQKASSGRTVNRDGKWFFETD